MTEPRRVASLSCAEVSGLAAGYVLGILEKEEMVRLPHHISTCPDPHPEIGTLGGVAPYLADVLEPVEPPADLGQRPPELPAQVWALHWPRATPHL